MTVEELIWSMRDGYAPSDAEVEMLAQRYARYGQHDTHENRMLNFFAEELSRHFRGDSERYRHARIGEVWRRALALQSRRRNPSGLPPGFFSKFAAPASDYTPPTISSTRQALRSMQRGDVVTVGGTQWVIRRVLGDIQATAYKHPSKHTKNYEIRLDTLEPVNGDDLVVVFEIGGSSQRVGANLVRGPMRLTGETVEL